MKWETIDETSERLKVPGGWIVRSYVVKNSHIQNGTSVSVGLHQVFVSDPEYLWILDQPL